MNGLRAEGLTKSFRRRRVVDGIRISVHPGEVVGLLGPNGAGKTTSFNIVVGLISPDEGKIFLGEREITKLSMHRRARLGVGYLPQEPSIFRRLSVEQNFLAILELQPGLSVRERRSRARALMEEFELTRVADSLGQQLSGGERRRVEVARAMIPGPSFILFDEPFAGVDPIAVTDLQRVMKRLRERGIGILITDHNVRETLGICDRSYIISGGRILEEGTPGELVSSDRARAVYLGDSFRLS